MKGLNDLLQSGNPLLYEVCEPVLETELPLVKNWVADPDNVMKEIRVKYRDENWQEQEWEMAGDLSELLQHEYDHLDVILCTMRAIDDKSFRWRA